MTDSLAGRFTERTMREALGQVATKLTVDASDARLLRLTNNAVYALPRHGVVIRITRSYALRDRVERTVRLAKWFERVDAPTIRLAAAATQPIEVLGMLATVWQYIPPAAPTLEDLGFTLREFHGLGKPDTELPRWNPVDDVRTRLSDAEGLSESNHEFLLEWCDWLAPRITEIMDRRSSALVHGDAHPGNLLRGHQNRLALCDFDATCIGPPEVDLVAVPVGEERFRRAGSHQRLASAYGYDVTKDEDWPLLREARELKMVAAAVPLLASAPGVAHEFTVRLQSIINEDHSARWTPFADITTPQRSTTEGSS